MDVTSTTLHTAPGVTRAAHLAETIASTAGIDPDELAAVRNARRRARTAAGLHTLYAARTDLDGVSPVAQFYAESVRWTA